MRNAMNKLVGTTVIVMMLASAAHAAPLAPSVLTLDTGGLKSGAPGGPKAGAPRVKASSALTGYDQAAKLLRGYAQLSSAEREKRLSGLLAASPDIQADDLIVRDEIANARGRAAALGASGAFGKADAWRGRYVDSAEKMLRLLRNLDERRKAKKSLLDGETDGLATLLASRMAVRAADLAEPVLSMVARPGKGAATTRREPVIRDIRPEGYDSSDFAGPGLPTPPNDIQSKADELGKNPIKLYEFVKGTIKTELYSGEMKGALETLKQGAGNDLDQCELLAALYQASGISSRIIQGTGRVTAAKLISYTGTSDIVAAQTALTSAGIPWAPVIEGGQTVAVDMEQFWVEARVPLSNYRGSLADQLGEDWVPLAPSFKLQDIQVGVDVLTLMGVTGETLASHYLSKWDDTDPAPLPLDVFRAEVDAWLHANRPDVPYDQAVRRATIHAEALGHLPGSLPFEVRSINDLFLQAPDAVRHRVHFTYMNHDGSAAVLDFEKAVSEMLGKRLILTYDGLTQADKDTLRIMGGVYAAPPAMLDITPVIKLDDTVIAEGTGALVLGKRHTLTMRFIGPAGEELVQDDLIAGNFHALILGGQSNSYQEEAGAAQSAAVLLFGRGADYVRRTRESDAGVAAIAGTLLVRPTPDALLVQNEIAVDFLFGEPMDITWKSVSMDADLRATRPVHAGSGTSHTKDFNDMAGYAASALEARVFQEVWGVKTTSTADFLGKAKSMSLPLTTVTGANLESFLASVNFSSQVEADIRDFVQARSYAVLAPSQELTLEVWTGVAYFARHPQDGGGFFQLSGRLSGAIAFDASWPADLMDPLMNPGGLPPNTDPNSVVRVQMFPSVNGQFGVVGEYLDKALAVYATDAQSAPVLGATIYWTAIQGGGAPETVSSVTDENGIAKVRFQLGKIIADSPIVTQFENDRYATVLGYNLVDAVSSNNTRMELPYVALAKAGAPTQFTVVQSATDILPLNAYASTGVYRLKDLYGNAVSNWDTKASVQTSGMPSPTLILKDGAIPCDFRNNCPDTADKNVTLPTDTSGNAIHNFYAANIPETTTFDITAEDTMLPALNKSIIAGTPPYELGLRPLWEAIPTMAQHPEPYKVTFLTYSGGNTYPDPTPRQVTFSVTDGAGTQPFGTMSATTNVSPGVYVSSYIAGPDTGYALVTMSSGSVQGSYPALPVVSIGPPEIRAPYSKLHVYRGRTAYAVSLDFDLEPDSWVPRDLSTWLYKNGESAGVLQILNNQFPSIAAGSAMDGAAAWGGKNFANLGNLPFFPAIQSSRQEYEVIPVDLAITEAKPNPIPVKLNQANQWRTQLPVEFSYSFLPGQEAPALAAVVLEDRSEIFRITAPGNSGTVEMPTDRLVDPDKPHTVHLEATYPTGETIKSDPVVLKLGRLIYDVKDPVKVRWDKPSSKDDPCKSNAVFEFSLGLDAEVTLAIGAYSDTKNFLKGENLFFQVDPASLSSSASSFTLTARITDPEIYSEDFTGKVEVLVTNLSTLPVGHTFVKGVDIFDGNAVISETDADLPGRGLSLELSRTYSSKNDDENGIFGIGWSSTYEQGIFATPCGGGSKLTIGGGDGSGQTFVGPPVNGFYTPQPGYHGSLQQSPGGGFDFFTKGHVRYHYPAFPAGGGERSKLEFIEDPNGNRIELDYQSNGLLSVAREASPSTPVAERRALRFNYESEGAQRRAQTVDVLVGQQVLYSISYSYDVAGHLVSARRIAAGSTLDRVSGYTYPDPDDTTKDPHNIVEWTDANGKVTSFVFYTAGDDILNTPIGSFVKGPKDLVKYVRQGVGPEMQETFFVYQQLRPPSSGITSVTDPRGITTDYRLNQDGAPLVIVEAVGTARTRTTTMEWSPTDIVKTKEIDALTRETAFGHDGRGNVTDERVKTATASQHQPVVDFHAAPPVPPHAAFDGNEVVTSYTYDQKFSKLTSKTDPEGVVTAYLIDQATGNVLSSTRNAGGAGPLTTGYEYYAGGDLKATVDPRGSRTEYLEYDSYGNPERVKDAAGNVTVNVYDARSRLASSTNANLGTKVEYEYDDLDRKTKESKTDLKGASDASVTTWTYVGGGTLVDLRTDGLLHVMDNGYDSLSRLTSVEHRSIGGEPAAAPFTVQTYYDGNDNKIGEVDGRGVIKRTDYDALNRPEQVVIQGFGGGGSDKLLTSWTYDAVGNRLTETDLHGHTTTFGYDKLYRVVGVTSPQTKKEDGQTNVIYTATTSYDLVGNKTKETDRNSHQTTMLYDRHHRLAEKTDSLGNKTVMTYDESDNVATETKLGVTQGGSLAPLTTKSYTAYDGLNRPTGWSLDVAGSVDSPYVTGIAYDDPEHKTTTTDSRRVETWTLMDGFGRVKSQTTQKRTGDAGDAVTVSYLYDANGNRKRVTDGKEHVTTYLYDGLNRLVKTTYPVSTGITERATYDPNGNVTESTDKRGIVRSFEYDDLNRLTREALVTTTPSGVSWSHAVAYNDAGPNPTKVDTDARTPAGVTTTTFDELDRVKQVVDPAGTVATFYDGVNKRREVDRRLLVTKFDYDVINRLTTTHYLKIGLGEDTEVVTYLDGDRQRYEDDRNGNRTTLVLDGLGRTLSKSRTGVWGPPPQLQETTELETNLYDGETANKRRFTDGEGKVTTYTYDHRQRLVKMDQGGLVVTETSYDKDDLKLSEEVGDEVKATFDYDELHRMTSQKNGANDDTTFTHDGDGNVLTKTEPLGQVTTYSYEELGKLFSVTMGASTADQTTTEYRYDENRNLVGQWDGEGGETAFKYDAANRRTEIHQHKTRHSSRTPDYGDGDRLVTVIGYDGNGNVASLLDPKNQTAIKVYDHLDRETSCAYSGGVPGVTVVTAYDGNGNALAVSQAFSPQTPENQNNTETMVYDHLDRQRSKTDVNGVLLTWAYFKNSTKKSVTDSATGEVTTYTYDAANRLESAMAPGGGTSYGYTADNLVDTITFPNSAVGKYLYDAADRVTSIETKNGAENISKFVYTYDRDGNRTSETQTRGTSAAETTTYGDGTSPGNAGSGFDALNRLKKVTYPGNRTVTYTYDDAGNRLSENDNGPEPKDSFFVYNGVNWLTEVHNGSTWGPFVARYSFDNNGNQIQKLSDYAGGSPATTTDFTFDVRDDLREIKVNAATTETASYGPDGKRTKKIGTDGLRLFTWDENAMLVERGALASDSPGTERNLGRRHFGLDQISLVENPGQGERSLFYHLDGIRTVSDLTDASGAVAAKYKTDAWGMPRDEADFDFDNHSPTNQTSLNRSLFTGHYFDREANLYSTPSRYYDPETGRFISQDGIEYGHVDDPPSLHRFFYAHSNPLRYVDSDGHFSLKGVGTFLGTAASDLPDFVAGAMAELPKMGTDAVLLATQGDFVHNDPKTWVQGDAPGYGYYTGVTAEPMSAYFRWASGQPTVHSTVGDILNTATTPPVEMIRAYQTEDPVRGGHALLPLAGEVAALAGGINAVGNLPRLATAGTEVVAAEDAAVTQLEQHLRTMSQKGAVLTEGAESTAPGVEGVVPDTPPPPTPEPLPSAPRVLTDAELQAAILQIHAAEFGSKGAGIPMTLSATESGRLVVSQVGRVPGPNARAAAVELLGPDVEVVRGTTRTNAPGVRGADAEARGIQHLGDEAQGARQASTHYACDYCDARQVAAGVRNVTGVASEHGGRIKLDPRPLPD